MWGGEREEGRKMMMGGRHRGEMERRARACWQERTRCSRGGLICCCSGSSGAVWLFWKQVSWESWASCVLTFHPWGQSRWSWLFTSTWAVLTHQHQYLLACLCSFHLLSLFYWLKHKGSVSACCTELHVIDMTLFGWCSCLEKTGVKAVGHLELRVMSVSIRFSAVHQGTRGVFRLFHYEFFAPRSASWTIVFLVRLLDTVPRGPKNNWVNIWQLHERNDDYEPRFGTTTGCSACAITTQTYWALIGLQILQREHEQSGVSLV